MQGFWDKSIDEEGGEKMSMNCTQILIKILKRFQRIKIQVSTDMQVECIEQIFKIWDHP